MAVHGKLCGGLGCLVLLASTHLQACGWPALWANQILQSETLYEQHLIELQSCTGSYDAKTDADLVLAALAHSVELGAPLERVRDVVIAYQCLGPASDQPGYLAVAAFLKVNSLHSLCVESSSK